MFTYDLPTDTPADGGSLPRNIKLDTTVTNAKKAVAVKKQEDKKHKWAGM